MNNIITWSDLEEAPYDYWNWIVHPKGDMSSGFLNLPDRRKLGVHKCHGPDTTWCRGWELREHKYNGEEDVILVAHQEGLTLPDVMEKVAEIVAEGKVDDEMERFDIAERRRYSDYYPY